MDASSCRMPFKMASQYVSAAKASEEVSLLSLLFFLEILPPDAAEHDILFHFFTSLNDVLAPLGDCNGLLCTSLLEKACKTVSSRLRALPVLSLLNDMPCSSINGNSPLLDFATSLKSFLPSFSGVASMLTTSISSSSSTAADENRCFFFAHFGDG